MVEPHLVLPEAEIKRLEEIEKKYNVLKHESANTDEKLKNHKCDHSKCEKKISELVEKYKKVKTSPDNNTTKEKESTGESFHEESSEGSSDNYGPGSTEYDPENIHFPEAKSKSSDAQNKSSDGQVPTSTTSNKPWYYIGPLENI